MQKKQVDMLSGSITKGLLAMTIPIMVMNVMQSLFSIMDMTVLRIFSNDNAVGAVGACGMLITLCTSLLIGVSVGANVIVARRIGSGDSARTGRAAMTALVFAALGGVALMLVGVWLADDFLKLTNCPEVLLPKATAYFRIYFLGVPVQMLYNFCASLLRATGDTKRPMYFLILGGVIKVCITLLLVTAFQMDVEGVACATIVANTVACGLAFVSLLKIRHIVPLDFKHIKMDAVELKAILRIGVPAGLQSALYSLANVLITSVVNSFGADATTGIAIANQFDGILYQISYAPSMAVAPYVAQNIGAGNLKRAKQALGRCIAITVAFGASLGSLSAIFSPQLSGIMSSTPEVVAFSVQKMIIISSTYFICGINDAISGALRGMGQSMAPMVSALAYMCALRFLWVYVLFPLCPTLTFLYTVWPVGWTLSIVTLGIVYKFTTSKLAKKLGQRS